MRRLRENGSSDFTKRELVELLLLYSVRQKDTNVLSDALFEYFGSMSEILEADPSAMMCVDGVSKNSAVLLSMIPQITRRVVIDRDVRNEIKGLEQVREFIPKCFIGKTVEHFVLVCLDKQQRMIRYDYISIGSVSHSSVDLRKIVHIMLVSDASYAVVAHNHPRGTTNPSNDDLKTTRIIVNAFKTIGAQLLDHIIVNSNGSFSIANAPSAISCCMKPDE